MSWKVESQNTTEAWGRQPTGKVSPTTAHWEGTGSCRCGLFHASCPKLSADAAPLPTPAFYLRFPPQSQDFPQIVQKSDQVEPVC